MLRPTSMIRGAVGATFVLVFVAFAFATTGAPTIRFDETAHDFGELRSDEPTEFAWTFRNVGDAPLSILGTRPQCGCTATMLDDQPVPPGGSGVIRVTFDPAGMSGHVRKSLAVMSNDPERSRVLLTIRAHVTRVEEPLSEGAHPRIAGRSLLAGDCASCHARPARGKSEAELFEAVCAMCHGSDGRGVHAPSIRDAAYLSSRSDSELRDSISFGTANPRMPGFAELMGGPLTDAQVESLVRYMRTWSDEGRSSHQ